MNWNQTHTELNEHEQHVADISILTPRKSASLIDQSDMREQAALLKENKSDAQPENTERKGPIVMKLIQTPEGFVPVVINDHNEEGWNYAKRLASFQQKLSCAALL
ncbi:hypothetical protein [Sulfurirhabdus autotrophica]|uniref:Uncharacterized protein n=1 Tax=Sulfurirhabdus autotrophica TaxID=1706046 RepID=A0A4R3YB03_9PROT|nr:hypothetical protein [Sulfurirhabdus autotrophica]TCV89605.1 hypothetical protein EDC63_102123 [Sulfurirhabdus autotrophica]